MQPTYQPNRNYYRDPGFQHGRKGGGYGNYYSKKVSGGSAFLSLNKKVFQKLGSLTLWTIECREKINKFFVPIAGWFILEWWFTVLRETTRSPSIKLLIFDNLRVKAVLGRKKNLDDTESHEWRIDFFFCTEIDDECFLSTSLVTRIIQVENKNNKPWLI